MAEPTQNQPAGFNINVFSGLGNPLNTVFPKLIQTPESERYDRPEFVAQAAQLLGNPMYFQITIDDVTLPNEPMITVTGSNVIVTTAIAGGDGTVKEFIGEDDYRINIKGRAVRETAERFRDAGGLVPDEYPEEWMRALARLKKMKSDLPVRCTLLSFFNISRLVIQDITFPPVPGEPGSFYYEINALSDESSVAKLIRK